MRLPVAAVIACPIRSALLLSPGRPFGQLVAILNSRMPCETAGAGKVAAAAAAPRTTMPRRVMEADESLFDGASQLPACRRLAVKMDMVTLPFSLTVGSSAESAVVQVMQAC